VESAIAAPPVQALDGMFHSMVVIEGADVASDVFPDVHRRVEAADERSAAIGTADQPVGKGEVLRACGADHEGQTAACVEQQPTAGGGDAVEAVEGQPRQGGRGGGGGGDDRHALHADLRRTVPERCGPDAWHSGQQPQVLRCRGAMPVVDGVAAAGMGAAAS
jgi:hypothetical protein